MVGRRPILQRFGCCADAPSPHYLVSSSEREMMRDMQCALLRGYSPIGNRGKRGSYFFRPPKTRLLPQDRSSVLGRTEYTFVLVAHGRLGFVSRPFLFGGSCRALRALPLSRRHSHDFIRIDMVGGPYWQPSRLYDSIKVNFRAAYWPSSRIASEFCVHRGPCHQSDSDFGKSVVPRMTSLLVIRVLRAPLRRQTRG